MASIWAGDRAQRFYLGVGLASLAAAAIGFSTTYFLPLARSSLTIPPSAHVHGIAAFAWLSFLALQAWLVTAGRTRLHMTLGQAAVPIALVLWASGIVTAAWAARRDLPSQGATAETAFFGTVTGLSIFLAFVIAGYLSRRRAAAHKRWMTLATIAVLWPALFRWRHLLPAMDRPDIILGYFLANLPILVAMLRDRFRYGAVHPVWLVGGLFWVIEQGIEMVIFDSNWSAPIGRALIALLP